MSMYNAGAVIRTARKKAGLTQEQLSEGICETMSLSCIERNTLGVSPATFRALMARTGFIADIQPVFVNRMDFDCFYALQRARFYVDGWFLQEASDELHKIALMKCAQNRFHYQEFLLLQCRLLLRSGMYQTQEVYRLAEKALRISMPSHDPQYVAASFLSVNEIELLLCLTECNLSQENHVQNIALCQNLKNFIENSHFPNFTKSHLLGEIAVTKCRVLLFAGAFSELFETAGQYRHLAVLNGDNSLLHELTFLTGLGHYYMDDTEQALPYIKTAFYSAHSIHSCYATRCRNYILQHTTLKLPQPLCAFPDIPLISYPFEEITDTDFHNGICDLSSAKLYQFGNLLHDLRTEKQITQAVLCQGLCTKSTLSKIENNTQIADPALAETLLQRLGISDVPFSFFSNNNYSRLHELRLLLIHSRNKDAQKIETYLQEMDTLLTDTPSPVYRQYFLLKKATYRKDHANHIDDLRNALKITLPDFQISKIADYRLSWNELTILNNLAAAYTESGDYIKSIKYIYMILDYLTENNNDILHIKRFYSSTVGLLIGNLLALKRYDELLNTFSSLSSPALLFNAYSIGSDFANYCQAFGSCGNLALTQQYATYACYNFALVENKYNSNLICEVIGKDYQLSIF